jgi:hypothetical protein
MFGLTPLLKIDFATTRSPVFIHSSNRMASSFLLQPRFQAQSVREIMGAGGAFTVFRFISHTLHTTVTYVIFFNFIFLILFFF